MKLLLFSDYYYIFNEIFQNFHSFTINLKEIYSNFERTQPILWMIPKVHCRLYVNIRNYKVHERCLLYK
jgi:hypothetical protein